MTILFVFVFIVNTAVVVGLSLASRSRCFGRFAGSALNPLIIFALIHVFANTDFALVYNTNTIDFLELREFIPSGTIVEAYCVFTLIEFGSVIGLLLAMARPLNCTIAPPDIDPASRQSASIIFVIYAITALVTIVPALRAGRDGLSFQMFSHDQPWATAAAWLQPMALGLFLAHMRRPLSLGGVVASLATIGPLILLGGSRIPPLISGLSLAAGYSTKRKLSGAWYILLIPALGLFLSTTRYLFRETSYTSFNEFLNAYGGMFGLFFSGEEISIGKMFSAVYAFGSQLHVYPFEGFGASLLLPIPRAFFALKPHGISALFTQTFSPERWELTGSELIVSGYGDLYLEFGAFGASLIALILCYVWMRLCILTINASIQTIITWLPLLLWSMYTFLRGDLFNLALVLWPTVLIYMFHTSLSMVIKRLRALLGSTRLRPSDLGNSAT